MKSTAATVGTTATKIIAGDDTHRSCYLHVTGNTIVYLGGPDVTTSNGLATQKHTTPLEIVVPSRQELWAVIETGTENVRILTPDVD